MSSFPGPPPSDSTAYREGSGLTTRFHVDLGAVLCVLGADYTTRASRPRSTHISQCLQNDIIALPASHTSNLRNATNVTQLTKAALPISAFWPLRQMRLLRICLRTFRAFIAFTGKAVLCQRGALGTNLPAGPLIPHYLIPLIPVTTLQHRL